MSKELDKLIEQMLAEKSKPPYKNLDYSEFDNISDDDRKKLSKQKDFADLQLPRRFGLRNQANKLRGAIGDKFLQNFDAYVKSLADNDRDITNITNKDVLAAYANKEKEAMDFLDAVIKYSTGAVDKKHLQSIRDTANLPGGIQKLADYYKANGDFDKIFDTEEFDEFVPTVDLPYRGVASPKDWKIGTAVKPSKAISKTVIDVFKRGMADAGGDLETFFDELGKLGNALSLVAGSKDKDVNPADGMTKAQAETYLKQMDPDKLFNTASLLKTLGSLAKEVQGASSGTFFEVFLALALGGIVFGGEGGASDVIAGKKGDRLFSAKQYIGKPAGTQAVKNFMNEVSVGKTIWYIGLGKQGAKVAGKNTIVDFNRLDIYITGIYRKDGDGSKPEHYETLRADGTALGADLKGGGANGSFGIPYSDEPDVKIPLSTDWASTETINSFDKMFSKAIDNIADEAKIKIKEMFAKIKRMQDNSQRFLANKNADSAQQIGNDYRGLKDDFSKGLGTIEDFKKQSGINESLDKLIEAIVKEKLLK
jgi:hypothetical protein